MTELYIVLYLTFCLTISSLAASYVTLKYVYWNESELTSTLKVYGTQVAVFAVLFLGVPLLVVSII